MLLARGTSGGEHHGVDARLLEFLERQSRLLSRRQVLEAGLDPHDIRRLMRRRELARVHPGVYIGHTGPLTWMQRSWAAVLFAEPAALCHDSAIRAADGPGRRDRLDKDPVHVAVDRKRGVVPPAGVIVHQVADLDSKVQWNLSPPRVRIEHAVLDVAAESGDDFGAIATIANAVQSRRTTAERMLDVLNDRSRIARREFLAAVLGDVAAGTCSVLEHGYLTEVERPHGLPRGTRQLLASARGPIYRDVDYEEFRTVVELDGRLFHDTAAARDRDLDRDLDAALDGRLTARLGWGQVYARPCETAPRIGGLLQQRGWSGRPTTCPQCSEQGQPGFRATG